MLKIRIILWIQLLLFSVFIYSDVNSAPLMIAHAGGGVNGVRYTNSIEALDLNYAKGYRYFEIDFSWTSDSELVCLHDWGKRFKLNFGYKIKKPLNLKQFKKLLDSNLKINPCTLDSLSDWVALHPTITIISDVKFNNIEAIKHIKKYYPILANKLIPQFYQPQEYKVLRQMGFNKLIWILYQFKGKKSSIADHAQNMELVAITMRASQVKKKWAQKLIKDNHKIFVYTVNKLKDLTKLTGKYGVSGVYTDFL